MNLNLMDPKLIVLAAAVVLVVVIAVALYIRRRRNTTAGLKNRFGPEYDRAVKQQGSERKAEAKLAERERYLAQWQTVQSRFVDYPKGAVTEADELVCSLMQTRGYPVADFDQRAADISVDHPRVVENYRSAHNIVLRLGKGEASTEELRTAMIHYRSLFDELVQVQTTADKRVA